MYNNQKDKTKSNKFKNIDFFLNPQEMEDSKKKSNTEKAKKQVEKSQKSVNSENEENEEKSLFKVLEGLESQETSKKVKILKDNEILNTSIKTEESVENIGSPIMSQN